LVPRIGRVDRKIGEFSKKTLAIFGRTAKLQIPWDNYPLLAFHKHTKGKLPHIPD